MADNEQVAAIKDAIVRSYRRGDCDHLGRHIPVEKRSAGAHGHYLPPPTEAYRKNYRKVFGVKKHGRTIQQTKET